MDGHRGTKWIAAGILTVVLWLVAAFAAALLICNISAFLSAEPQFQAIFAQLRHGHLGLPWWLLIPQGGLSLLILRLRRAGKPLAAVCAGVPLWLVLLLCTLYCTRVNGILFGDVMVSLVQVLGKGGLDL